MFSDFYKKFTWVRIIKLYVQSFMRSDSATGRPRPAQNRYGLTWVVLWNFHEGLRPFAIFLRPQIFKSSEMIIKRSGTVWNFQKRPKTLGSLKRSCCKRLTVRSVCKNTLTLTLKKLKNNCPLICRVRWIY
jgi:hypothetical protein